MAAETERLIADGVAPDEICVLVRSVKNEGAVVSSALEERAIPSRTSGSAAYFQRAEVRDMLAWLRALADPGDSGAVVRALSRPPVELRSVDVARLTQLARRRKLDMPSAVAAALEGPQLSEEGRDRARVFLRLYRSASQAFEDRRPDAFVLRLIERTGLRRQQVFATHADTVERLRNIAKLPELATAYMRREPQATARDFTRYLTAVAESGLREEEVTGAPSAPAVQVMTMHASKGLEFDHVFVLGLSASRMPGTHRARRDEVPDELLKERLPAADDQSTHEAEMRRLLHVAMTRPRKGLVMAWSETGPAGATPRPSPFYEEARAAVEIEEEVLEEELFGPAEGLHSTFRLMRDELLDTVARVGGHLGEMRLDTYLDVDQAVSRYLELIKVAALIERTKEGQTLETAPPELNEILTQCATPEQRDILGQSALDAWLRDTDRDPTSRPAAAQNGSEPSLDPFIPRRGRGLMLSASDIDTYRICPLKYKFARVFRIPQEPTIHQRFGIAVHQVLERFHTGGGGDLPALMELFEASWRRSGFGDSDDEHQFRDKAVSALERYWLLDRQSESRPAWIQRSFAFRLGPHLLRGRVDRVDRHPDGSYELIDYKTGKAKQYATVPSRRQEQVRIPLVTLMDFRWLRRRGDGDGRAHAARAARRAGVGAHGGRRGDHQHRRRADRAASATSSCPRTGWPRPAIRARTRRSSTRCAPSALELCPALGIAIPGRQGLAVDAHGVDARRGSESAVTAPLSLIVSAFAPVTDVRRALTPQLRTRRAATPKLLLIDLGAGQNRLGGSALAQVYGSSATTPPDLDDPALLRGFFDADPAAQARGQRARLPRPLRRRPVRRRSCEMAFAGALRPRHRRSAGLDGRIRSRRCSPRSWARCSRCARAIVDARARGARDARPRRAHARRIGTADADGASRHPRRDGRELARRARASTLHARVVGDDATRMQRLRDNPRLRRARSTTARSTTRDPGLRARAHVRPARGHRGAVRSRRGARPRVAILREQGVNGQVEMAAAFDRAGFDASTCT